MYSDKQDSGQAETASPESGSNGQGDRISFNRLDQCQQWVLWREELRNGRHTKVPYSPIRGRRAKANDRTTWGSREQAEGKVKEFLKPSQKGGIGVQLGPIDGLPDYWLCGVDLDTCRDPESGRIELWGVEVMDCLDSYTEISPSRTGAKIYFAARKCDLPPILEALGTNGQGEQRYGQSFKRGKGEHPPAIEVFMGFRYFAFTGENIDPRLPSEIADLIGPPPAELRIVSAADVLSILRDLGPAFARGDDRQQSDGGCPNQTAKPRDESRSGYAFRLAIQLQSDGRTFEDFQQALDEDADGVGLAAWAEDQRQVKRAWRNAGKRVANERAAREALFDDLGEGSADKESASESGIDPVTARLNREHAIVMIGGKVLVATERPNGRIEFGTARDLHTLYENRRVYVAEFEKSQPASVRWLRDPNRRTYSHGVALSPAGTRAGMLNLWRGWAVEPDPHGSCDLLLDHLLEIICDGNEEHFRYLVGWLAHLVQKPEEKPGVAIVCKGKKGIGKDVIGRYVGRLMHPANYQSTDKPEHLTGRFNGHLAQLLLFHVEEAFWAGDPRAESVLKGLITRPSIPIERKGIDVVEIESYLRIFMSANADWVVPTSPDERRYAVFNVSSARLGDRAYFRALHDEMENGGPAALMHYLRNYDLSDFDVRQFPETAGLRDQKLATLKNIERWWFDCLYRGELPDSSRFHDEDTSWDRGAVTIGKDELRGAYGAWMNGRRYGGEILDDEQFTKRLLPMLPHLGETRPRVQGKRVRSYVLPSLEDCRAAFDAWLKSAVEWQSDHLDQNPADLDQKR